MRSHKSKHRCYKQTHIFKGAAAFVRVLSVHHVRGYHEALHAQLLQVILVWDAVVVHIAS